MSSYQLDITIFIKVFNTVQDMTHSHKLLLTILKEMELKNSDEFDLLENQSSNLIALLQLGAQPRRLSASAVIIFFFLNFKTKKNFNALWVIKPF